MRARALHVIALAMFMGMNSASQLQADEFEIFDDPSPASSFEIVDEGATATEETLADPARMDALEQPLDSYPDPVVDQQPATDESEPEGVETPAESYSPAEDDGDSAAYSQPAWESQGADLGYQYDDYDDASSGAFGNFGCGAGGGSCGGCSGAACHGGCGGNRPGAFLDVWAAGGYTYNEASPQNGFNGPVTFNDFSNQWQFNQLYLTAGRAVNPCGGCWDLGGRIDLLYGTDYFYTTARGLETRADGAPHWNSGNGDRRRDVFSFDDYGLAMPQVYAEVFAPLGSGLDVKLGHFYTILGYESVRAPENFFYSHSYTFQYGKPITQTGVLADWAFGSKLNFQFGYTRGWDNWEDLNGKPNYLAGFTWCPSRTASVAFALTTGREDLAGINDRTAYTLIYTRRLGAVTYVFEHTFGSEANAEFDTQFQRDSGKWYGINQYLFTEVSPTLTTGMRVEWFRDQDNTRVLQIPFESAVSGGNYVGLTLGLNWRPTRNLIVRPEIRYDYSDAEAFDFGNTGVFDDFTRRDQLLLAIDAIFRF